jgi:hypothetical protein
MADRRSRCFQQRYDARSSTLPAVADDDLTRALLARMHALGHIRLARGVVGKASVVAGIALLVLGAIAMRIDAKLLLVISGMVLLAFFVYLAAVMWFAHRHPEQALLEGAEIIQYRHQEMAARGFPVAPQASTLITPQDLPTNLPEIQ